MATKDRMLRVAKLAFEDGLNKSEIAQAMEIDARNVTDLINQAGRWLMVEQERLASIHRETVLHEESAKALRLRWPHLIAARVVRCNPEMDYAKLLKLWGVVAAEYFDELVDAADDRDDELHVGVSGGETILQMMSALPERKRNAHFYAAAIIGRGRMLKSSHVGPETNATLAWARSGNKPGRLHYASVLPYSFGKATHKEAKSLLQQQLVEFADYTPVTHFLKDLEQINVAIAGLGLVNPRSVSSAGEIDRVSMTGLLESCGIRAEELEKEGAIGDCSYCLFDANGQSRPDWKFLLTAGYPNTLQFYKELVAEGKPVIVIAGPHKLSVLKTALENHFFSVLITDENTATELIG